MKLYRSTWAPGSYRTLFLFAFERGRWIKTLQMPLPGGRRLILIRK